MGICASCLGVSRRGSPSDPSDTSQLLADSYQPQYGSIGQGGAHAGAQPDPEEIRRQRDALERICAQTSDKLIDVSQAGYTDPAAKVTSEWHRLFLERFPPPASSSRATTPETAAPDESEDEQAWLNQAIGDGEGEHGHWERVEGAANIGPLTIQFDEALNPDRKVAAK